MGAIHSVDRVLLLLGAFGRHDAALAWSQVRAATEFGRVALTSPKFEFSETDYYTPTMGAGLKKQFFAFERLIDPGTLATVKRQTNEWEAEYLASNQHSELRPLNLDPGYITPAKLVLATTKDHAHRIYIGEGIYAEVTLSYRARRWQPREWTYPDYQREDYQQFFSECRRLLSSTPA
jgi:hypothetical protein